MAADRHKASHLAVATAVTGFVTLGIALPIVVGGSDRLELHGAGLVAAPRDHYAITEPLNLYGVPGLVIERGAISISERQAGKLQSGEAAAALLASGTARLVLEGGTVIIDRSAAATAPGEPAGAGVAPLVAALHDGNFEALSVQRTTLLLKMDGGRLEALGELNGEIVYKRKASMSARGTLTVRGHKLALDATLGLPAASDKKGMPARQAVKAQIKGPMFEASFEGRLLPGDAAPLQGHGEISVRNLRDAARWIGLGWPAGPGLADFRIKGPLEWSSDGLAFQRASMQMDGNEATGALSLGVANGRPAVSATLAMQSLDLSRYVKTWRGETSRSLLTDVMSPGMFSLPLVRHLDADVRISANKVRTGSSDLGQCAATLTVKNGKLLADIAEVQMDEARGSGQLTVDMSGSEPRYTLRGRISGFEFARINPETLTGSLPLQGRGDLVADVSATGETQFDMLRTLSGKMAVSMPTGGRVGLDLRSLLAAAQKQPLQGWSGVQRGTMPVESLQGRIVLSEGAIFTESFSAAAGDAQLTASGGGNLRNGTVDLRLSMGTKLPDRSSQLAQPGATVEALILRGPWRDPSIRAELSSAAPVGLSPPSR